MKIKYLPRQKIDIARWDEAVSRAHNGLPYTYSWYLDIVAKGNWDALVSEDYEMIFPLVWNRKKVLFRQVYQPFYAQQLGLFAKHSVTGAEVEQFLAAVPRHFGYCLVHLNEHNPLPSKSAFTFQERANLTISLKPSYEEICQNYSRSVQKNLRKAANAGLHLSEAIEPSALSGFYQTQVGHKISGVAPEVYQIGVRLMEMAIRIGKGKIFTLRNVDGDLAAAGFFLISNNRIINNFGASSLQGKETGAMHFLIDRVIHEYAESDGVFDFEGSSIPSIAAFFKSFGAQSASYHVAIRSLRNTWLG